MGIYGIFLIMGHAGFISSTVVQPRNTLKLWPEVHQSAIRSLGFKKELFYIITA